MEPHRANSRSSARRLRPRASSSAPTGPWGLCGPAPSTTGRRKPTSEIMHLLIHVQPGSWNAAFRASRERELAWCRSTLLHERSSALADFLKRHFEATKFVRTQFREHSLHLRGMLSKGRSNEVLAARGKANDPHPPVFGALDPPDQTLRDEAVDSDTDRASG